MTYIRYFIGTGQSMSKWAIDLSTLTTVNFMFQNTPVGRTIENIVCYNFE